MNDILKPVINAIEKGSSTVHLNGLPINIRVRDSSPVNDNLTPRIAMIHHTAGNQFANINDLIRIFDGWTRVGYHFVINGWGRVYAIGNPINMVWGAANNNSNTIHIALMGNFITAKPTVEQLDRLSMLLDILSPRIVKGHSDVNNTLCPAPYMLRWINLYSQGLLGNTNHGYIDEYDPGVDEPTINDLENHCIKVGYVRISRVATHWLCTDRRIPDWIYDKNLQVIEYWSNGVCVLTRNNVVVGRLHRGNLIRV